MRSDNFRVSAHIDLDAIRKNMEMMKSSISGDTLLAAVVKSDAYGHGAVEVSKALMNLPYLWGFAVATVGEAMELIRNEIDKPVLILGSVYNGCFDVIAENGIRTVIYTEEEALALSKEAEKQGKKAFVHLACDVGMGRIGFKCNEAGKKTALKIASMPGITVEGIFTHFPCADSKDKSLTLKQLSTFKNFIKTLEDNGLLIPVRHCANSACILEMRKTDLTMSRAGISLYGLCPSDEVGPGYDLKPALALKSHIVYIKEAAPKDRISYGGTFTAQRDTMVATIPVGYGDGYPRGLSNKGYVLIHGKKAPILGRVCMDQFMVDVTDIPEAKQGDEVTLIGRDGDLMITMEELAGMFEGGFNYEIPCQLTKRVPRIYHMNGEIAGELDHYAF